VNRLRWLAALAALALPAAVRADTLDDVQKRGELRWGGDEEGGAPYIVRTQKEGEPGGFEGELMAQLAARLGVRPKFAQCQWDNLLQLVNTGGCDVVVNGYELTADRLRDQIATIPYFIYELQLFARRDDGRLAGWEAVGRPKPDGGKWLVGVLDGTAAEKYLATKFADSVEVKGYKGTTEAFRDVVNGQIDATLTDTPAAVAFGPQFKVKPVGPPVERGYYVIYLRPGDERLRDALNDGLRAMLEDGRLKDILQRYQLWNETQESLARPDVQRLPEAMKPQGPPPSGWSVVGQNLSLLLKGAGMTVLLSVTSMPLAILLGLAVALGRLYGPWPLRAPLALYVEVVRGTPLLLQLLFIYFVIPSVFPIPDWLRPNYAFIAGVVGLAVNYSAYESEIYRAGLLAIPGGQTEAALALGLTRGQALRYVVVPQAVRLVVPPVTNDFIALFKDTAVCSVITIRELSKEYYIAANNSPQAYLELALVTALLYLAMSYPLSLLTRRLERRVPAVRH
jgi:polar amino acid transport system substrate-binding protein